MQRTYYKQPVPSSAWQGSAPNAALGSHFHLEEGEVPPLPQGASYVKYVPVVVQPQPVSAPYGYGFDSMHAYDAAAEWGPDPSWGYEGQWDYGSAEDQTFPDLSEEAFDPAEFALWQQQNQLFMQQQFLQLQQQQFMQQQMARKQQQQLARSRDFQPQYYSHGRGGYNVQQPMLPFHGKDQIYFSATSQFEPGLTMGQPGQGPASMSVPETFPLNTESQSLSPSVVTMFQQMQTSNMGVSGSPPQIQRGAMLLENLETKLLQQHSSDGNNRVVMTSASSLSSQSEAETLRFDSESVISEDVNVVDSSLPPVSVAQPLPARNSIAAATCDEIEETAPGLEVTAEEPAELSDDVRTTDAEAGSEYASTSTPAAPSHPSTRQTVALSAQEARERIAGALSGLSLATLSLVKEVVVECILDEKGSPTAPPEVGEEVAQLLWQRAVATRNVAWMCARISADIREDEHFRARLLELVTQLLHKHNKPLKEVGVRKLETSEWFEMTSNATFMGELFNNRVVTAKTLTTETNTAVQNSSYNAAAMIASTIISVVGYKLDSNHHGSLWIDSWLETLRANGEFAVRQADTLSEKRRHRWQALKHTSTRSEQDPPRSATAQTATSSSSETFKPNFSSRHRPTSTTTSARDSSDNPTPSSTRSGRPGGHPGRGRSHRNPTQIPTQISPILENPYEVQQPQRNTLPLPDPSAATAPSTSLSSAARPRTSSQRRRGPGRN